MARTLFFPGLHRPNHVHRLERCMVSANVLEGRISDFKAQDWILDSGAFTRITRGLGHRPVEEYAAMVNRWSRCGNLLIAVAQDYMCEPIALQATGMTVRQHQALSTESFLRLRDATAVPIMPVVQGWAPADYRLHAVQLSKHLESDAWVGVGSVCKRQGDPAQIVAVLRAIRHVAPEWRLHGFGVKATSLLDARVTKYLYSADSMAWSFAARMNKYHEGTGRGANSVEECIDWTKRLEAFVQ